MHPPVAKIAFLIADLGRGGAERVGLSLIQGFVARGHEVDLLLMRQFGVFLEKLPPEVRVINLNARRIRNVIRPLGRYLRKERPDALQVSMWPLPVAAIIARALARVPTRIVLSEHSALSRQYGGSVATMAFLKASTRLFYPLADQLVTVSEGSTADLVKLSGLEAARVTTIHNPIAQPPEGFVPDPTAADAWAPAKYRILTVGALKPEKNHRLLIESFARLVRDTDASLLILGEGEERPALEALATRLGLQERVRLPGFTFDTWSHYAAASLFVLASDFEGFGNVLVEALAFGLPVVSTDCDFGPREILEGGELGSLVPCGSADALAGAMRETLVKPADHERLKARAKDFSEDRATERYLELLLGKPQ